MSLRLAMLTAGVPVTETGWLMQRLGIQSVAEIAGLNVAHVVRVPRGLRAALIRLRLRHGAAEGGWEAFAEPYFDAGGLAALDWAEYEANELERLADLAVWEEEADNELQVAVQGMQGFLNHFAVNADNADNADAGSAGSASDAESSDFPTETTSTAELQPGDVEFWSSDEAGE
jgi:hypothetical protein